MSKLQLTLALFKPDVSSNPVVLKQLRSILTKNNFIVAQESSVIWDRCQVCICCADNVNFALLNNN